MSSFASRQLRLRVLEALEVRVKQFLRREELWPLRVPREPLLLDDVVRQAIAEEARRFDVASLKSRSLVRWNGRTAAVGRPGSACCRQG